MKPTVQFLTDYWPILAPILWEIVVRLNPTDKSLSLLTLVFRILNSVFPDKNKNGGTHIVIWLLMFLPLTSIAQNNIQGRAMYNWDSYSASNPDTAAIKATLTSYQSLYGDAGGLYYNKFSHKWRIWVHTCPDTSQHNGCWVDLPTVRQGSTGTVTSVDITNGTNITHSGGPITTSGSITVNAVPTSPSLTFQYNNAGLFGSTITALSTPFKSMSWDNSLGGVNWVNSTGVNSTTFSSNVYPGQLDVFNGSSPEIDHIRITPNTISNQVAGRTLTVLGAASGGAVNVATSAVTSGTAGTLALAAGGASSGANGGLASLTGGSGTSGNSPGGSAQVLGGSGNGTASGGSVNVTAGAGGTTGAGGSITLQAGAGTSNTNGSVNIRSGTGGTSTTGDITLTPQHQIKLSTPSSAGTVSIVNSQTNGGISITSTLDNVALSAANTLLINGGSTDAGEIVIGNTSNGADVVISSKTGMQFETSNLISDQVEIATGSKTFINPPSTSVLEMFTLTTATSQTVPAFTLNGLSGRYGVADFTAGTGVYNFYLEMLADASDIGTARFTDNRASKKGIEYAGTGYVTQTHSLTDKEYVDLIASRTGTATLDFPNTTTGISDLTISVTSATVGKGCRVGVPNGSVTATANFWCWVSSSGTVTVRFSPKSVGGEDPASGTFTVYVDK